MHGGQFPTKQEQVAELEETLDNIQFPTDSHLRTEIQKLTNLGCDEKALCQLSFLYAFTYHMYKKNAEAEAATPTPSRLIAFPGLQLSRSDLARRIREARTSLRQMVALLTVVRKPGEGPDEHAPTRAEAVELRNSLKSVILRSCRLLCRAGVDCAIPNEKRLQRDRCLCSLIEYVKYKTGKPNWEILISLVNAWGLTAITNETTLRMQYKRASKELPLFTPETAQNR
jgi:hypothetical protein